ncbi:MAG: DUF3617 family protein [Pseudobdellovibrio sp.]
MKFLLLTSLILFSFKLLAQSFEAGLWKAQESLNVNGIQLPASSFDDCVSESEAKDARATIEKELKKQSCVVNKWSVKNQKLDAAITCKSDTIDATGKLVGEFTRKSYNLSGEAEGTYMKALPALAKLKLSGRWVKKCSK